MKRKIATRRLKRKCIDCNCTFSKGEIYYINRRIYDDIEDGIYAIESIVCPRCKFKRKDQKERYEKLKKKCHHPEKLIIEKWSYIPGEVVMQPDHDECLLCGEWL